MQKRRARVGQLSKMSFAVLVACSLSTLAAAAEDSAVGPLKSEQVKKQGEQPGHEAAGAFKAQQTAKADPTQKTDVALLKEQFAQQQKEIDRLRRALQEQRELLERFLESAQAAQPSYGATAQSASLAQAASLTPVIPAAVSRATTLVEADPLPEAKLPASGESKPQYDEPAEGAEGKKSPLTLRIGDADFTVGGFVDATAFFRSTNLGSGIGTSFGSIPFSNTPQGQLSETRFSAQNSRLSLMATSKVGENNVKGYVESDFLGFQPTNGFVTSNSNSMRMRLYWVQVLRGKFEFLGGQSWSMMNPNRNGLSPMPSDIFYSQDMDTNYQVGLTWSRNNQFRFIYHATDDWAAGISLENPQQFVGGGVVLPASFSSSEVDAGGNVSTPNLHPDVIGKIAYDPKVGEKHMHVEVAGLLRSFRTFDPVTSRKTTVTGGGGSVNANLELVKNFHLIADTFYSDGGGRYIFGLGPDLIIKADNTPSLVHAASGIGGFEYQFNPQTMLYGYYGGAYFQRNTAIDPKTGKFLGFGFPGSSSSANKAVQEGTFGVIQTFWKNPRYGALQLITQYSYLTRAPWWVATGSPKNAHLSMGYADVRYVLP